MLPMMPGGKEIKDKFTNSLILEPVDFEYRWTAD